MDQEAQRGFFLTGWIWAPGLKLGPRAQILCPGVQIWGQGPNFGLIFQVGGPGPGPILFQKDIFWKHGPRILTTTTFRKKLSPQAFKPFPEGAPRKVSMFKICLAGRSSDMCISWPESTFLLPTWQDSGCGFFKDSDIPRTQASCVPRTPASWVPTSLGGCGRLPPLCT